MLVDSHTEFESLKEWQYTTLGEVADFINGDRGKNYPSLSDRVENGVPFINTGHIEPNGRLSDAKMDYITRDRFDKLGSGKVKQGDIVYCLRGSTIGKTARNQYKEGAIASSLVIVRAKPTISQDFLYFFLVSPVGQQLAKSNDNGSAQPNLSVKVLSDYPLFLPPLSEQKAIAHILGTLDDRIELNRQMNETLESMAQTLFKSWFVDFDPVIDNALASGKEIPEELQERADARVALGDKRKPLPEEIRSLFPDEFTYSEEMGWIPMGWRIGKVCDLGNVVCGKTPPTKDPENYGDDIPFITIPDMHGTVYVTDTSKKLSHKGADTQKKKYLPVNSICVSCIATPGLVVLNSIESQTNQQINSVIPDDKGTSLFCYGVLSLLGEQIRIAGSGGSVFANLSKGRFEELRLLLPTPENQRCFDKLVSPYYDKILLNQKNIYKLMGIRDTLLPKLLSGELRIPDAEKLMEEAI